MTTVQSTSAPPWASVYGTNTIGAPGGGPDLTGNALIEYCASKLGNIDNQVSSLMNQQNNINSEQNMLQNIQSDINTLLAKQSSSTGSTGSDPVDCAKLEQDLENMITTIEQTDPGCSELGQLQLLHDTVMGTGTGPYVTNSSGAVVSSVAGGPGISKLSFDSNGNPTPPLPPGETLHGYYGTDPNTNNTGVPPAGTTAPASLPNSSPDNNIDGGEVTSFTNTVTAIGNGLNSEGTINMIKIQSLMSDRTTAIQLATSTLQSLDDGNEKIVDNIGH